MKLSQRPEMWLFVLAALIIVCSAVLTGLGKAVPSWFEFVAVAAVTGGAGLAPTKSVSPPAQ